MSTFTKNTIITFIVRVLAVAFGILITVIIARVLGPEKQGIYSLVVLLPSTLLIFSIFGVNISSIFYIGKKKYSPQEVFSNNIFFTFFFSIIALIAGLLIIFFFGEKLFPGVEQRYLLLALSLIPFNIFFELASSVLLGKQELKKYNLTAFLRSFIFLLLIAILILGFQFGVKAAILAQIFSFIFAGIVLFFITLKVTGGLVLRLNKNYFKEALSYGLKNYLAGVLNLLHYRIDQLLINVFINPVAVGFYYVAVRLAEGIWLISQSAAIVLFPKVAAETDEQRLKDFTPLICRNVLFITFLISVVLFIFSHWVIVFFYSENFLNSVRPFQILLIGTLFIAGWRILANDIAAQGRPMLNTYIIGFSVLLNIILNVLWIPRWGIEGAAYATMVSYFLLFFITIFLYARISGNKIIDVIFVKKSDFLLYKNALSFIKRKTKEI